MLEWPTLSSGCESEWDNPTTTTTSTQAVNEMKLVMMLSLVMYCSIRAIHHLLNLWFVMDQHTLWLNAGHFPKLSSEILCQQRAYMFKFYLKKKNQE